MQNKSVFSVSHYCKLKSLHVPGRSCCLKRFLKVLVQVSLFLERLWVVIFFSVPLRAVSRLYHKDRRKRRAGGREDAVLALYLPTVVPDGED